MEMRLRRGKERKMVVRGVRSIESGNAARSGPRLKVQQGNFVKRPMTDIKLLRPIGRK